jgi:putative ABC transport system permease protein
MTIETRDNQSELTAIRTGATAAGMLLALGILAMTVGLIRSEAAGDLRTLTATGATSTTRRTLTAATSGALALLGVLLGATGAYLALLAGYHDDLGTLSQVPLLHLTVTVVGLPLTAAAVGWLLAGREPPTLARQPLA